MDRVCNDHAPLIITRSGQQSVVILSLEDFLALEETAYWAHIQDELTSGKVFTLKRSGTSFTFHLRLHQVLNEEAIRQLKSEALSNWTKGASDA